jgi:hypothetical protein
MNMKQNIIAVTLAIIVPVSAFALGGNISSPQLQFPDGAKHETIVKLLDYLRNDLMFIEGSFINEFTSQGFSGSATKATGLIQLLQQSGFELTVQFADLKDDRIALRLSQDSRRRETTLVINITKKDFVLSDLVVHLPARGTGVEQGAAPNAALPRR